MSYKEENGFVLPTANTSKAKRKRQLPQVSSLTSGMQHQPPKMLNVEELRKLPQEILLQLKSVENSQKLLFMPGEVHALHSEVSMYSTDNNQVHAMGT